MNDKLEIILFLHHTHVARQIVLKHRLRHLHKGAERIPRGDRIDGIPLNQ